MIDHKITKGLSRIYTKKGSMFDTGSSSLGVETLDFLISTPTIVNMIIEASHELLDSLIPDSYITVGKHIDVTHEKPTLVDENISLILTVEQIEDDKIYLDVHVNDSQGQICKGKYLRVITNKDKLIEAAYSRSAQLDLSSKKLK